jgi:uroporphyrinogen-III synthase
LIEFATSEGVQYYAFTSAMSARAFLDRFEERCPGRVPELLSRAKVGAIGPPTALALEERGVVVDVIPSEATFPALMMALAGLLGAATRDDLSEPTS